MSDHEVDQGFQMTRANSIPGEGTAGSGVDEGVGKPTCVCNSAASEMATLPEKRRWGQKGVIKNME